MSIGNMAAGQVAIRFGLQGMCSCPTTVSYTHLVGGPAACDTAPITMDGKAVFRFAVETMPRCLQTVLERSQKTVSYTHLDVYKRQVL